MSVSLKKECDVVYVGYHSGDIRAFDAMTGMSRYHIKVYGIAGSYRFDVIKGCIRQHLYDLERKMIKFC